MAGLRVLGGRANSLDEWIPGLGERISTKTSVPLLVPHLPNGFPASVRLNSGVEASVMTKHFDEWLVYINSFHPPNNLELGTVIISVCFEVTELRTEKWEHSPGISE